MQKIFNVFFGIIFLIVLMSSMNISPNNHKDGDKEMHLHLSEYGIFKGRLSDLIPTADFHIYEVSSPLFSNYAMKQRLIKLPKGSRLKAVDDYLPEFPDGTILVKSFYYPLAKENTFQAKRIIETRLLIRYETEWIAGTYIWNEEQTDATLAEDGGKTKVDWIDEDGKNKSISYKIPSKRDCISCHGQNDNLMPIGFKIRNLNREIERDSKKINQLEYLNNQKLIEDINPSHFSKLPNYNDVSENIEKRGRAYLEINCAHCHNDNGSCSNSILKFAYENSLEQTHIKDNKGLIKNLFSLGIMPKTGTSTVDKQGLQLLKQYLKQLK